MTDLKQDAHVSPLRLHPLTPAIEEQLYNGGDHDPTDSVFQRSLPRPPATLDLQIGCLNTPIQMA